MAFCLFYSENMFVVNFLFPFLTKSLESKMVNTLGQYMIIIIKTLATCVSIT